jgi:serine/threonine-protein kinase
MSDDSSQHTQNVGKIVLGRYQIIRLLGEGGMGGVYECEHVEIGKRVAIKFVSSVHAKSPQIAARLKREARSTGALDSEHVVQVFDAGEDPELGLFLVMELLKGKDLCTVCEGGKRLSPVDAAHITVQATLGLEKAHEAGIIHRDLKPANIFVCQKDDGRAMVKLVDFGIAKLVRDAEQAVQQNPGLTRAGTVIGTPQYMSPEQAQGLDTLDHRTDVYSLGAVLFEMLTGESPHPSMPTYEQTILQIVLNAPPRVSTKIGAPNVPPDLDDLVASMLAREPGARPPSMKAVRAALNRIFPEIENRRLTMAAIVAGVSQLASSVYVPPSEAGLAAARAAGQSSPQMMGQASGSSPQMQVPMVRGSGPLTGPSTGTVMMGHTPTSSPNLMYTPSSSPNLMMGQPPQMQHPRTSAGVAIDDDAHPAGVPRRSGAGLIIGIAATVCMMAILSVVAVFKLKSGEASDQQTSGGLSGVVGTASAASARGAASASPSAQPSAIASASSAPAPSTAPLASNASTTRPAPWHPINGRDPALPPPPASVAKNPKPPASTGGGTTTPAPPASQPHQLGATGIDTTF